MPKAGAESIPAPADPQSQASRAVSFPRRIVRGVWRRLARVVVRMHGALDAMFVPLAARSRWLSSVYYAFWSRAFAREHQAMLNARLSYAEDLRSPGAGFALLRRNVHRLEKGLLMRPRRDVFGVGYIEEAMECYEHIRKSHCDDEGECGTEMKWAHDVLKKYFEVTTSHEVIDRCRKRFDALPPVSCESGEKVPYKRDLAKEPSVSYDDLMALAMRRRSVRWFLPKAVDREMIDRAVTLAGQSPSACNRQPFSFRIFDEKELVQKVIKLPMGTSGFSDNVPVVAVVVGRIGNYPKERDRHLIYIDGSLATMAFVFAIESQGLSTCCINWPDIEELEVAMSDLLRLAPDERPIMCVAVGHPDPEGEVAYSDKKPLDQMRQYNRTGK